MLGLVAGSIVQYKSARARPRQWGALVVGPEVMLEGAARRAARTGSTSWSKTSSTSRATRPGRATPSISSSHHLAPTAPRPRSSGCWSAGARLVGKAVTDEFTWSLAGTNPHYGTPRNPRDPDRIPGGSSSGSAVAVAAGLVPFALGTDTAGSVRVPASYCGVFGMRPTHGRVDNAGVVPLAPSYDTVGWFARSGSLLRDVGAQLFDAPSPATAPTEIIVASDAFALVDEAIREELIAVQRIELGAKLGIPVTRTHFSPDGMRGWQAMAEAYPKLMAPEAWATHGPWLKSARPKLGAVWRLGSRWPRPRPLQRRRRASPCAGRRSRGTRDDAQRGDPGRTRRPHHRPAPHRVR